MDPIVNITQPGLAHSLTLMGAMFFTVTRFGEISALWQFFEGLFNWALGQLWIDVKVQILKNYLAIWSH